VNDYRICFREGSRETEQRTFSSPSNDPSLIRRVKPGALNGTNRCEFIAGLLFSGACAGAAPLRLLSTANMSARPLAPDAIAPCRANPRSTLARNLLSDSSARRSRRVSRELPGCLLNMDPAQGLQARAGGRRGAPLTRHPCRRSVSVSKCHCIAPILNSSSQRVTWSLLTRYCVLGCQQGKPDVWDRRNHMCRS